jgi:hypothetical protein
MKPHRGPRDVLDYRVRAAGALAVGFYPHEESRRRLIHIVLIIALVVLAVHFLKGG